MEQSNEKSKKLENKVNELIKKIESEKSKPKRLIYIIKCKMLINKLEREINLIKAKASFKKAKEDNNFTAAEEKAAIRTKISKAINDIEKDLKANRKYDFKSSDFIFSEEIENKVGVKQLTHELVESGNAEQIEVAKKIEETRANRLLLEGLKKDLNEQKENLNEINVSLKSANNRLSRQNMMVTAKSKFNIFAKMRNLASSIVYGIIEVAKEAKENRRLDKEKVADFNKLQLNYEKSKEIIRQRYQEELEKLDEKYEEAHGKKTSKWDNHTEEKGTTRRNGQAAKFQEELKNMSREGEVQVEEHDSEEIEVDQGEFVVTEDGEEIGN